MKVARLYDFLDVRVEEDAIPQIAPGEALVRARVCGICSGDVVPWYIRKKAPLVLGHEPVGEVVEVRGSAHVRPGDRVFVHHHAPCLSCRACARGEFVQCDTWRSSRIVPGGMAEYFRVPAVNLSGDTLRLPDSLSDEDGALVEPLACVVKSMSRAGVIAGASVLVIGLGVMGQMHVLLARHLGAERLLAADLIGARREHARGLGATDLIDPTAGGLYEQVMDLTAGAGAELVVVGPATVDAIEQGLRCAARGGVVIQFMGTEPGSSVRLPTHDLYFREVRFIPSYSCGPIETRQALELISGGVVKAEHVVTHRFPLPEVAEAYRVAALDKSSIKTLVRISGESTRP